MDVHPYEEAQGFQRLLDMPGYDVTALALKSGKSASHIYARLSLLQLIPEVAQAFAAERITASHANLIARLPQEQQAPAFEQCWRKDWNDQEAHLLPAKHVAAWIETHLYLALAEAPFDREDSELNPTAGACVTCPRRSGYNTSLFADVQGDQCLDGVCYQAKVARHIEREMVARPELVQIETSWRPSKEQRPGILPRNSYRELNIPDNPDAEPPCLSTKSALIVFGRKAGKIVPICIDDECPVHDPATVARLAKEQADNPAPVMESAPETETPEEAELRQAEYEQRREEHEAEQLLREEERRTENERQQQEYEAEQKRREELRIARAARFECITEKAPVLFTLAQFRAFLRLLVHIDPYSFLEEVASQLAGNDENVQKTDEEIVLSALDTLPDDKLTGMALRLVLTDHVDIPRENKPDLLSEAEVAFRPILSKSSKRKAPGKVAKTGEMVKLGPKKSPAKKLKAA